MSRKLTPTPELRIGLKAHPKPNPETICIIPCSLLDSNLQEESHFCNFSSISCSKSQSMTSYDTKLPSKTASITCDHNSSPPSFSDNNICTNRTSNNSSSEVLDFLSVGLSRWERRSIATEDSFLNHLNRDFSVTKHAVPFAFRCITWECPNNQYLHQEI
ncbi:hypothetical protein LXL04_020598 [Taraxacum kok-saghyz]